MVLNGQRANAEKRIQDQKRQNRKWTLRQWLFVILSAVLGSYVILFLYVIVSESTGTASALSGNAVPVVGNPGSVNIENSKRAEPVTELNSKTVPVEVPLQPRPATDTAVTPNPEKEKVEKVAATPKQHHHPPTNETPTRREGVIILGMHRSGTSIMGGLASKMGLKTGGPLIMPHSDNEKGFYERIDVVLQNDKFMEAQKVHYAFRTEAYVPSKGLQLAQKSIQDLQKGGSGKFVVQEGNLRQGRPFEFSFNEGQRGLKFLNDKQNYPWMLKDPRLCITLDTWLPLLDQTVAFPAILFTYRHPMDVALSLQKREQEHFRIPKTLRMWYVYNMRALQQSQRLCRVTASHKNIMVSPEQELGRVYSELRERCGVQVPRKLNSADIADFIDTKLQHGKNTERDRTTCDDLASYQKASGASGPHSAAGSSLEPPIEQWKTTEGEQLRLYREVMRVYCAMEDGSVYSDDFQWDTQMRDAGPGG